MTQVNPCVFLVLNTFFKVIEFQGVSEWGIHSSEISYKGLLAEMAE